MSKIRSRVTGGESRNKLASVPRYLVFNEHILSGYRVNFTVRDSLMSLFTLHNESINIWSHVFGFVLFLVLLIALCWRPPIMDVELGNRNGTSAVGGPIIEPTEGAAHGLGRNPVKVATGAYDQDVAAVFREPILRLQRARAQLGKALHVEEVKDLLRKILADVANNVFSAENRRVNLRLSREKIRQSIGYLQAKLKRKNVGKALHIEEVKGRLLELETQLRAIVANNFKVEYWPIYLYLVGAMFCMLSSSMAHTFSITSPKANMWWWRIDYVGIAVMISTSYCPVVYYVFLQETTWRNFYLAVILAAGALVAGVSLLERFQEDSYRVYRAYLFVAYGFFAVIPLFHALTLDLGSPLDSQSFNNIVMYEVLMGVLYLGGALVYATQFPEFMFPGKFDLFFNSHQVFHIAIVLAAYTHYMAVMQAIEWRYGPPAEISASITV